MAIATKLAAELDPSHQARVGQCSEYEQQYAALLELLHEVCNAFQLANSLSSGLNWGIFASAVMALVTAPLSRRDDFPYRTLSEREIRVVVVKHARRPLENNLTCYIQHITLGLDSNYPVSVPYTALSYTWGDGKDVTSLKLQDEGTKKSGDITVTRSLVTALQTILEPRKHYTLWIDQICIDQSSTEEKGQQVQFMRWIYERATVIYVWLGPANEGSDIAMIYLKDYDKVRELYDLNPILEEALKLVFRRPYWSRTWTLQEVTGLEFTTMS